MTFEEFKALSREERRSYIVSCREQGLSDRQTALSLGLEPEQVGGFYHITERLGIQASKSPDKRRIDSLCWECKNACGRCSWSREFKPVPGWEAIVMAPRGAQMSVKLRNIPDYRVITCPEFTRDRRKRQWS